MQPESKEQILQRQKEIEQELVGMLKETGSDFTLDHVRDAIFHEEDDDDMMKVVAMFDRGGDAAELGSILELVSDAWNCRQPRCCWKIRIERNRLWLIFSTTFSLTNRETLENRLKLIRLEIKFRLDQAYFIFLPQFILIL